MAKRGRPKKIPDREKRETLWRTYIALTDFARLKKWSPEQVLGRLAKSFHVKKRTIRRYLSEFGVRSIRTDNKNILRGKQAKKTLRLIREMKRKSG